MNLARIFHTVRYLKPIQIYGRLSYRLKRNFYGQSTIKKESERAKELKKQYPPQNPLSFKLTFLNETREFSPEKIPWESRDWPIENCPEKLWMYNLNYFSWVFDQTTETNRELNMFLILDWIENNTSTRGESWEPFPLSKRIVNWSKWLEEHPELVSPVKDCINNSIFSQCQRLLLDLEYHNQANHLFENLKALFLASIHLLKANHGLPHTILSWAQFAGTELIEQINEQFFPDGGHYERSPMYHSEMFSGVKAIYEAARASEKSDFSRLTESFPQTLADIIELCQEKIPLLKDWLINLTHPDGYIALFNDSALIPGIKTSNQAEDKPISYLLSDSGFFIRRWQTNYFVLSCNAPSPKFQPGHTHCDVLSYELSINGLRCIVDTGCGSYQNPEIREHCRKTSSHNLPLIELTEQSDIWGEFRIGKRSRIISRNYDSLSGLLVIEFADQYNQRFKREIVFEKSSIRIRDRMYDRRITGTFCSLIHLHPGTQIIPSRDNTGITLTRKGVEFQILTFSRFRTETHEWYPEFGKVIRSEKLILSNHETEAIDYVISWKT